MKYALSFFTLILLSLNAIGQCPVVDQTFTTQAQVNNFKVNFPSCQEFDHYINLSGAAITNVNGLSNLTKVSGLTMQFTSVTDLSPLANLTEASVSLSLFYNGDLTSLNGLNALTTAGDLVINETPIASLSALQNVTALRTLGLRLTQVSNLDGLENLVDLGNLNLQSNDLLSDISAINNAVYKTTVGPEVRINGNPLLTECAVKFVCNALSSPPGTITTEVTSNGLGCASIAQVNARCEEIALPVALISFDARKFEEHSVSLSWATASESNSRNFELQRSQNGAKWVIIASLNAQGESGKTIQYSFVDSSPTEGNNLYRLKMIDTDGTFAYSKIVNVNMGSDPTVGIYPNPATDKISLDVQDLLNAKSILISDLSGKKVYASENVSGSEISVKHLSAGLFLVKIIKKDGSMVSRKLVKN
ncbi:MAG: T9SS type A sorting domain-containing protein [Dyadobacter sp.]|uniref:T9SS type A sorting domain-containing protein n=1 Tax=Dyadobacter sp. TaxID=1914288 RepID=UPI003266AE88